MRITNLNRIHESLKQLREESGLTQKQAGDRVLRHESWVDKIENDHMIDLGSLIKYAHAIGYNVIIELEKQ